MIEPATKDEISTTYRESLYEMQNGDRVDDDPHLFEINLLKKKLKGWDDTMEDEDGNKIPYSSVPAALHKDISEMDQDCRTTLFNIICNPSRHRARLVAAEKNG